MNSVQVYAQRFCEGVESKYHQHVVCANNSAELTQDNCIARFTSAESGLGQWIAMIINGDTTKVMRCYVESDVAR